MQSQAASLTPGLAVLNLPLQLRLTSADDVGRENLSLVIALKKNNTLKGQKRGWVALLQQMRWLEGIFEKERWDGGIS